MNILIVDDEPAALRDLEGVIKSVRPEVSIEKAGGSKQAIELCQKGHYDVVFLDISMPDMDGLTLATEIKRTNPLINIIIVTAYSQFAMEAHKMYVSGYLLKPVLPDDIREAFANLRNPIRENPKGLYVRCFGIFTVFYDGKPMKFKRSKTLELFAYLIDQNGGVVTSQRLQEVLWTDTTASENRRNYLAQLVRDLQTSLDEIGYGGAFMHDYNSYAIDPSQINCDYYLALEKEAHAMANFNGRYMSQYSWAEESLGSMENLYDEKADA